ncbi:ATP-binding response regulator [Candidatus Rickettsiella viridis]|uniref:ATP-binding response regulator n=1 Tax=Candidatus Rickettsiella viridis TaxID=676208 RepID=UPI000F84BECA|nr:ATP-binding protein [Candidatus Rickettsiella viridis]
MTKKKKIFTNENNILSLDSKLDTPEKIHHYYQKIIGCMPNNVYWLDRNCITQGCNNNILKLLGLKTLDEFIGITYKKMGELAGWTEGQAESFERDDREVMETGVPKLNIEEPPLYDEKGNPIYYMSSREPIFDDKGKEVIGVIGISVDITQKKKDAQALILAKEKAEIASQAKTEFLENMRHDIRTPISGIVGNAHLIQMESDIPKKVTKYVDELVQSSDALLEFLDKILENIKAETGEIPVLKHKFDLKEALDQIVRLNKSQALVKGLELNLDYDQTIPTYLLGDSVRIQKIILELLTNALKYTAKGSINISARLIEDKKREAIVELRVSDTGMGIPKDKHGEVYKRFTRLMPSYQGIPGTGLGLSTVKQFIEDLHGEIHIESDLGKGTTFICLIPLQKPLLMDKSNVEELKGNVVLPKISVASVVNELLTPAAAISSHRNRVLIVEDNTIAANVAHNMLSKLDCQTDVAPDGKTALEKIEKNHYDLVLMDMGLPDGDGCDVTQRIRLKKKQPNPSVPIIGLTAHVEAEKK